MIRSEVQNLGSNYIDKENTSKKDLGNVIFECDNKLPSSIENVVNLFKVIKKYRKEDKKCNFETIVTIMKNNYDMNENETRRCIASLYLDGAISIMKDIDDIIFSSKLSGKRNYPTLLREKIRLSFLTNICQMYIKMNLQFEGIAADFDINELMEYLKQENVKIQRVKINEELLSKFLEKLSRSGFLNKRDGYRYAITNKAIKFGQRMEVFSKYCSDFNVEKIIRKRQSRIEINKSNVIPNNNSDYESKYNVTSALWNGNSSILRDIHTNPELFPQIITSNISSFHNVNMMTNVMDSGAFHPPIFPIVVETVPIFSQIIPHCYICGHGYNENGIIVQCTECNVHAHVVCEQFFNCSKATKWCKLCRYSFQSFIDNTEEINLLCQECLNTRQNSSEICFFCQDNMLETDKTILNLENLELKERIEEILSKDDSAMLSNNCTNTEMGSDEFVPQTLSFVEMLNESEDLSPIKTESSNSVNGWTVQDVGNWLIEEGYGRMCLKFKNEEIDGTSLLLLLEADLALMKVESNLVSEIYSKIKKLK